MRVEYCPGLGMANGKTMMEILLMDALDHHLGLDQLRLNNPFFPILDQSQDSFLF